MIHGQWQKTTRILQSVYGRKIVLKLMFHRCSKYAIKPSKALRCLMVLVNYLSLWRIQLCIVISELEKSGKLNESLRIYDDIHSYSIRYNEIIFRKDYVMNYIKILVSMNNYIECIKVLSQEIDFLMNNDKCKFEGISVYILDLMLIYLITHNAQEVECASEILE